MGWATSPATTPARRLGSQAALLGAALLLGGAASPITELDVAVTGLRSAKGLVRVCLTADPRNFPDCVSDARAVTRSVPADTRVLSFPGLAPGGYALAVIHDENANSRLDTFAGIPREGFGFSRDPVVTFGPPRFSAARFAVGGVAVRQQVRVRYIL